MMKIKLEITVEKNDQGEYVFTTNDIDRIEGEFLKAYTFEKAKSFIGKLAKMTKNNDVDISQQSDEYMKNVITYNVLNKLCIVSQIVLKKQDDIISNTKDILGNNENKTDYEN